MDPQAFGAKMASVKTAAGGLGKLVGSIGKSFRPGGVVGHIADYAVPAAVGGATAYGAHQQGFDPISSGMFGLAAGSAVSARDYTTAARRGHANARAAGTGPVTGVMKELMPIAGVHAGFAGLGAAAGMAMPAARAGQNIGRATESLANAGGSVERGATNLEKATQTAPAAGQDLASTMQSLKDTIGTREYKLDDGTVVPASGFAATLGEMTHAKPKFDVNVNVPELENVMGSVRQFGENAASSVNKWGPWAAGGVATAGGLYMLHKMLQRKRRERAKYAGAGTAVMRGIGHTVMDRSLADEPMLDDEMLWKLRALNEQYHGSHSVEGAGRQQHPRQSPNYRPNFFGGPIGHAAGSAATSGTMGALLGTGLGALAGNDRGHTLAGMGRGFVRGGLTGAGVGLGGSVGTQLGSAIGGNSPGGQLGGMALGQLAGSALGGAAGWIGSGKLLGEPEDERLKHVKQSSAHAFGTDIARQMKPNVVRRQEQHAIPRAQMRSSLHNAGVGHGMLQSSMGAAPGQRQSFPSAVGD